jgi:hypothetical protein
MFRLRTSLPPPTSAYPARKSTKPGKSATRRSATRASFVGRSIGPAENLTKAPDTRRRPVRTLGYAVSWVINSSWSKFGGVNRMPSASVT